MTAYAEFLRLSRRYLTFQHVANAVLAAAAVACVWQPVPQTRLLPTGSPWLMATLSTALIWFCSAICLLGLWLSKSVDDLSELVPSAAQAAVPAMWIAPGIFLLAVATPLAAVTGFALIVAGVWLTFGTRTPQRRRLADRTPAIDTTEDTGLMLSEVNAGFLSEQSAPLALAAVLAHLAMAAVVARLPLLAAALAVVAAASAALAPASRHTPTPATWRKAGITFVAAVTLAAFQLRTPLPGDASSFWSSLLQVPQDEPRRAAANTTPLIPPRRNLTGKDLVPGVILKPNAKRDGERDDGAVLKSLHPGTGLAVLKPLALFFTGEYELFPESSSGVGSDAAVFRGTPLDAVYGTTEAGALATHAVQRFRPWLDCSRCARIVLTLVHGERSPGLLKVYAESAAGREEIGSEMYGFTAGTDETLSIDIPPSARLARMIALRIAFHPLDPSQRSLSVRVAIRRLVWEPVAE